MQFNKTIKLLICFVMIFPYLLYGLHGQASAASNYNHSELMEYEGYGKAMYEGIVDQTTFITGQYTENKEYVNQSIDEIRDYAKFWWEENKIQGEGVGEKLKDLVTKAGGYTLTVGDWIKNFFTDYEDTVPPVDTTPDFSTLGVAINSIRTDSSDFYLVLNDGYSLVITNSSGQVGIQSGATYGGIYGSDTEAYFSLGGISSSIRSVSGWDEFLQLREDLDEMTTYQEVFAVAHSFGLSIGAKKNDIPINPTFPGNTRPVDTINNYIQNGMDEKSMVIPQPKPSLTCPGGEKINLTVDGSTFIGADGSVMLVNKDGTATVNGTSCSLEWQKPEIGYVDDKAAITDPQGNWLDALTGDVLECVLEGGCVPAVPDDDKEEVDELDNALIEYVKNAYEYATGVLKTATDGLKSLATGAKDLTALFGTFFSWLPKEMVVLMSSGLGIAIGLRLFRK